MARPADGGGLRAAGGLRCGGRARRLGAGGGAGRARAARGRHGLAAAGGRPQPVSTTALGAARARELVLDPGAGAHAVVRPAAGGPRGARRRDRRRAGDAGLRAEPVPDRGVWARRSRRTGSRRSCRRSPSRRWRCCRRRSTPATATCGSDAPRTPPRRAGRGGARAHRRTDPRGAEGATFDATRQATDPSMKLGELFAFLRPRNGRAPGRGTGPAARALVRAGPGTPRARVHRVPGEQRHRGLVRRPLAPRPAADPRQRRLLRADGGTPARRPWESTAASCRAG